ncbi:Nif3-like dinuclear metal center hexameric protein [Thermodesulfobacteriota bacterium]
MVPKLEDILKILDEMAPFLMAEEWDNSGFQVGCFSQEIKKILIALDPTIKAVRNASDTKAQLLLTHHPLVHKPLTNINIEAYPGDVIDEALKKRISIVAVHTNLDVARGGINDILANLFGLDDVEVLQRSDELVDNVVGIGRIGYLPKPKKLSVVTKAIKDALGTMNLRVVGSRDTDVRRVAVVGGSGGEMAALAKKRGADLLVTGDIGHHDALVAEALDLALIDGGHFETERIALSLFTDHFGARLKEQSWDVILEIYRDEKDPIRYE